MERQKSSPFPSWWAWLNGYLEALKHLKMFLKKKKRKTISLKNKKQKKNTNYTVYPLLLA